MNVDEFLTELYNDELSDAFIGNRNSKEEPRQKLLGLMNTGMVYAYAKYKIVFTTTQLVVTEDVNEYELPETNILQIIQLFNPYGRELEQSEYQVLGKTIYFPYPENTELQVVYKVKHTKYTEAQTDEDTDLVLPDLLVPWLKAYVCHRYFASGSTEEQMLKAANFLAQAQMCEQVFIGTNTTGEFTAPTSTKAEGRGFP